MDIEPDHNHHQEEGEILPTTVSKFDKFKKEIIIRTIKILDIGYITSIYVIIGLIITLFYNKVFYKYDPKKDERKSLIRLIFEMIGLVWLGLVIGYIIRNIVELIPSPFDGLYGFNHRKVKELTIASGFVMSMITIASIYGTKFRYFGKRFTDLQN